MLFLLGKTVCRPGVVVTGEDAVGALPTLAGLQEGRRAHQGALGALGALVHWVRWVHWGALGCTALWLSMVALLGSSNT